MALKTGWNRHDHRRCAKCVVLFVKHTFLTRTAREMQIWHWPDQLAAFGCSVLIITALGPFETYSMPILERLFYWTLCLGVGWTLMIASMTLILRHPSLDDWPGVFRVGLAVAIASVPITLAVGAIEDWLRQSRDEIAFAGFVLNTALICGLISIAMYFRVQDRLGRINTNDMPSAPFLQQLPFELGKDLISLSMQDHYIEVATSKGTTLVLMSLRDALEELGDYKGIQIHRSHWIAASAFQGLERCNGKLHARLSDGRKLPVSRTYSASARKLVIVGN